MHESEVGLVILVGFLAPATGRAMGRASQLDLEGGPDSSQVISGRAGVIFRRPE